MSRALRTAVHDASRRGALRSGAESYSSSAGALFALAFLLLPASSNAQHTCRFATEGASMRLLNDCVTHAPLDVPDGMTFDGDFHTIVAADPPGGSFRGPVIRARGASASVVNTAITTDALRDVCHEGADRIRGIYFEGASGLIRGNSVDNIRKPGSACEEGTAIEVRQGPVPGPPAAVTIDDNLIARYQKSGIVLHGFVDGVIRGNVIGSSAAQAQLAANSVQIGPGAGAVVDGNTIFGNSHPDARAAGTAILLVASAPGTTVSANAIVGNADVGIHVLADRAIVTGNELLDEGADGYWDVGIVNLGTGNVFTDNTVDGFRTRDRGLDAHEDLGRQQVE